MVTGVNWGHPLNRGLLAWWPASASHWRGRGWVDLVRGNVAARKATSTPTNTGEMAAWRDSPAYDTANESYLAASDSAAFSVSDWHMSAWIWVRNYNPYHTIFLRATPGMNTTRHAGVFLSNGNNFWVANRGLGNFVGSPRQPTNTWFHLTVSCTLGGVASAYVNGSAAGAASIGTGASSYPGVVAIGYDAGTADFQHNGRLADLRFSGRTLEPSEVKALYRESLAGYPGMLTRAPHRPRIAIQSGGTTPPGQPRPAAVAAHHFRLRRA